MSIRIAHDRALTTFFDTFKTHNYSLSEAPLALARNLMNWMALNQMTRIYKQIPYNLQLLTKHTCFISYLLFLFGNYDWGNGYEQLASSQKGDEICIYIKETYVWQCDNLIK